MNETRRPTLALVSLLVLGPACSSDGADGEASGGGGAAGTTSSSPADTTASSTTSSSATTSSSSTGQGGQGQGGGGDGGAGQGGAGAGGREEGTGGRGEGGGTSCEPIAVPRGLWAWSASVVTVDAQRDALLAFAAERGVDRIFVHGGTGGPVITGNLMQTAPEELAAFLDAAAAQCISVELLFGDPSWALRDFHDTPLQLAEQLVTFSEGREGARPVALHLDAEAHGVHGVTSEGTSWDWNNDGTGDTPNHQIEMVGQYLELLAATRDVLAGSDLLLSSDIPFWYDGAGAAFNPQDFLGEVKPASEHVIDLVQRAVLMDYRDSAFGSGSDAATSANGIHDLASSELAYASETGAQVVIGVETLGCETVEGDVVLDGELDDVLTFCDEGAAVMETELAKVVSANDDEPGFAGLAIHHYAAWSDPARMER